MMGLCKHIFTGCRHRMHFFDDAFGILQQMGKKQSRKMIAGAFFMSAAKAVRKRLGPAR